MSARDWQFLSGALGLGLMAHGLIEFMFMNGANVSFWQHFTLALLIQSVIFLGRRLP